MSQTFHIIWYLPAENTWKDFQILAYKDVGTLTFENHVLTFAGQKETLRLVDVAEVKYGKQGRDFINNWVLIRSGDGSVAYFADGGWRGWRGILGGTKKLYRAAQLLQRLSAG
jgi:hypothetical protein